MISRTLEAAVFSTLIMGNYEYLFARLIEARRREVSAMELLSQLRRGCVDRFPVDGFTEKGRITLSLIKMIRADKSKTKP
jgi:hypothetical protein